MLPNLKRNNSLFTIIFFITFFILGIFIFSDFGLGIDEDNSRLNGFVSLNYIFENFFPESTYKINNIINVPDINNYSEQGNGVVFDLPMAFAELIFKVTDDRQIYLLRHFFNFLLFFVSVYFFYKIIINRYNSNIVAIIGSLFLIASPRIFAESFYNTKDIAFMSIFIISLFSAINFLEKPNNKTAIIFSFVSALAVDVRILGIFFPLLIFLIFIIIILRNEHFDKVKIIPLLSFIITLPLFIILFWPYLWADPLGNFIEIFTKLGNLAYNPYNFYFGEYISSGNVPWHYSLVWIFITTPIYYLILFLVGFIFILYRFVKRLIKIERNNSYVDLWRGKKELQDVVFFLTFLIPLFATIYLNSTLYDGWRHLYFIYPTLIIISLHGFYLIKVFLFKNKMKIISIFTFLIIFKNFYWMYSNHPFQNVYFNILAGKKFNERFEMDYWGISNKNALEYIAKITNHKVNVYNLNTSDLVLSKKILKNENRDLIRVTYDINNADYIINSFRDWNGGIKPQNYLVPSNFEILYEIKVDDVVINSIYKKK